MQNLVTPEEMASDETALVPEPEREKPAAESAAPPNRVQALEAVLFAAGDPVRYDKLQRILGLHPDEIDAAANELQDALEARASALTLREVAGGLQIVTKPEYYAILEQLTAVLDNKLTTPTMETLSIIAYRQPITKAEIETIRGVRIEKSLARLIEYGLIEEAGRKQAIGRPILYATTDAFLEAFGLGSLDDLPALPSDQEAAEGLAPEQLDLIDVGELRGN